MNNKFKLQAGLLALRISSFIVMLMWTLDKFINPGHAARVFAKFYFIHNVQTTLMYVIGGLELLIILGFVFGVFKTFTYGAVFVFHAISTVSSYTKYLAPWQGTNLLFFAAITMLAGLYMLFMLREEDSLLTLRIS